MPTAERLTKLLKVAEAEDPVTGHGRGAGGAHRGQAGRAVCPAVVRRRPEGREAANLPLADGGGGEQHTGPTKTHASRQIALDPICVEVLWQRWGYMYDLAERAESPLMEDPYVLSYNANGSRSGQPRHLHPPIQGALRENGGAGAQAPTQEAAEATRDDLHPKDRWPYRFHDLRHFSVTTLIAGGVDIRTVAERHGHARATMTLDRYAHALPERDRAAADLMGSVLGSSFELD